MTPIFSLEGVPRRTRPRGAGALCAGFLAGALSVACSGAIDGGNKPSQGPGDSPSKPGSNGSGTNGMNPGGTNNPGGSNDPGGMTGTPVEMPGVSAAPTPLRRLSATQYLNTVRDLLRMPDVATLVGGGALPADDAIAQRFATNISGVKGLDADKYADVAALLAAKAVENPGNLIACAANGAGDEACASEFIGKFGRRAFRRPMSPAEVERYKGVYKVGGDFKNGIRLVLQTFLQSPKLLYLVEPVPENAAGQLLALDSWSMASRLSYFLLGSTPDDALLDAAEKGELKTADQVGEQAKRLVADARWKGTVQEFHRQWLELDEFKGAEKDPMLFPLWNDEVKAALTEQVVRYVDHAFASDGGQGKLGELLSSPVAFLKGPLYDIYGVPKPAGAAANEWAKVELDGKQLAGLLTQAVFMASMAHEDRTSFILRGKLVREALLCTDVPPPPPGFNASESNIPATATARERSMQHRTDPACTGCHSAFDTVGFAFEVFDAVGRFRLKDSMGRDIDSKLDLAESASYDGSYPNAVEFLKKLSSSKELGACLAKQWMRFGLGREIDDAKADKPSLAAATKALEDSGGKLGDLLTALARSDAFRHQKVQP